MQRQWGSHLVLPWTTETTGNRHTTAAGLPRALVAVRAHCVGAPASGKASTGVRKLGFHLLWPKSEAKQALYRAFCLKISQASRTPSPNCLIWSGVRFCCDSSVGDNLLFLLNSTELGGGGGSDWRRKMMWGVGFVGWKGSLARKTNWVGWLWWAEKERKQVGPQGGFGLEANVEEWPGEINFWISFMCLVLKLNRFKHFETNFDRD
jgi:hypothetical protein